MKQTVSSALVAFLFAMNINAQDTVTSYYSVCPSTSVATVTAPTTITLCPGPRCNGGAPVITAVPTPITVFGPDGRPTIYNIQTTILPALCDGGVCGATYTLSEKCPCNDGPKTIYADECPDGFMTSHVACTACAAAGGPATVTVTIPKPDSPYAAQTPAMGSPYNGVPPAAPQQSAAPPQGDAPASQKLSAGSGPSQAPAPAPAPAPAQQTQTPALPSAPAAANPSKEILPGPASNNNTSVVAPYVGLAHRQTSRITCVALATLLGCLTWIM